MNGLDPQDILDRLDYLGSGAVRHLNLDARKDLQHAAELIRDQIERLEEVGPPRPVDDDVVGALARLLDRAAHCETDAVRMSIHRAHAHGFLARHRLVRVPDGVLEYVIVDREGNRVRYERGATPDDGASP